ncbi:hypothetical protein BRDID11004_48120 [Bradyrhizobium diazoefficiens]|uniref:Uncharacterized protein n=1 Tax=Bradyrhizobium diazoefficiens TaxID=1355477 RepID=A0A809ZZN8_9BRAD|nr:hypothetical protein [Bradyrhizobium diazoefficiens]BBZ94285.1 hypothetical protein F07S3_41180 [Bradyrhizobium diazoefficiens]BCE56373.1 hypothetical protein XF5B_38850 [Bradyrhizobium diazoefficiens]
MILEPGTFRVSDYRKAIPTLVKLKCLLVAIAKGTIPHQKPHTFEPAVDAEHLRFDHRPPLEARPYDTAAGDFIPPQNDPAHLEALTDEQHDFRTFGRRPGAEITATTRGSDIGEAARIRNIKDSTAQHHAIMAAKAGLANNDMTAVLEGLAPAAKRQWPKRPFDTKGKRKFGP